MIKNFENFKIRPNVNVASQEFWKMVTLVNWKDVINSSKKTKTGYKSEEAFNNAEKRLVTNYEYTQIEKFEHDYRLIFNSLADYFEDIWLDDKYRTFMPSDDGYSDVISSIVGKGKWFTKKCIENTEEFIDMIKNDDYVENFGYLFQMNESQYIETRSKYDPLFRDMYKYNL